MGAVRMFIDKFQREVLIDVDHPLAVAQRAKPVLVVSAPRVITIEGGEYDGQLVDLAEVSVSYAMGQLSQRYDLVPGEGDALPRIVAKAPVEESPAVEAPAPAVPAEVIAALDPPPSTPAEPVAPASPAAAPSRPRRAGK